MNVKPGDLAKIVAPHFRAGVLVSVDSSCTAADRDTLVATESSWAECGQIWMCRLLTGSRGVNVDIGSAYLLPGDDVWVDDKYLRRIDPKADDTDEAVSAPAPRLAVPA